MASLRTLFRFMTHPMTIIAGVVLGFLVGFRFPGFSTHLKPAADIYIALLSMCVLPILVSALIWGVGQILRARETRALVGRMAVVYGIGLLVPCIVGIAVAVAFEPGASLGEEAHATLGQQLGQAAQPEQSASLLVFVQNVVPTNVFEALSRGQFISIVFFCILVGLALGVVRAQGADEALAVLNALYQTFSTLFHWVLVPLALGLFCIVAYHASQIETELVNALVRYVAYYWVAGIIVLLIQIIVLSVVTGTPPWTPLLRLKTPLLLAFATDNPFVALYSAVESLQEDYAVSRPIADTIVPFGVLANQQGQVLLFSFTSVFVAQVYGVALGPENLLILGLGCVIAGAAAVGGGAALAPILAPVLLAGGVPDALALVVLSTTQSVVANLSSTLTVMGTCNLTVLTARGARPPPALQHAAQQDTQESSS
jgi:proton glutamate symport protein